MKNPLEVISIDETNLILYFQYANFLVMIWNSKTFFEITSDQIMKNLLEVISITEANLMLHFQYANFLVIIWNSETVFQITSA